MLVKVKILLNLKNVAIAETIEPRHSSSRSRKHVEGDQADMLAKKGKFLLELVDKIFVS